MSTFEKLKEMVGNLDDANWGIYSNASKTRKRLSDIKKEADRLRKSILDECKLQNPKIFKKVQE